MVVDVLEDPVRHALAGPHASLAVTADVDEPRAWRYPADVSPFADVADVDDPAAWDQLAGLTGPGGTAALWRHPDERLPAPRGWSLAREMDALQMVATAPLDVPPAPGVTATRLTEVDAAEMLALAELTRPGPFGTGTVRFGGYVGARVGGDLVAMAGRRVHPPGWVEVSGVCTRPDHRGKGLSRQLVAAVAAGIRADGDLAFLHVMRTNDAAIRVYERLGFEVSRRLVVQVFEVA